MSHDCSSHNCKHQYANAETQTDFSLYKQGEDGHLYKVEENGTIVKEATKSQVDSLKIEESPRSPSPYPQSQPLLIDSQSQRPPSPIIIPSSPTSTSNEKNDGENSEMEYGEILDKESSETEKVDQESGSSETEKETEQENEDIQMRYDDFHTYLNCLMTEHFKQYSKTE